MIESSMTRARRGSNVLTVQKTEAKESEKCFLGESFDCPRDA